MFLESIIILTLLVFLGIRFFISLNNMNGQLNDVYKIVFIFSGQMYNLCFIIYLYDYMYSLGTLLFYHWIKSIGHHIFLFEKFIFSTKILSFCHPLQGIAQGLFFI